MNDKSSSQVGRGFFCTHSACQAGALPSQTKNGGILDIRQESGLIGGGDEEEVEETEDAETDEEIEGERVRIHAEEDQGPYSEQGE